MVEEDNKSYKCPFDGCELHYDNCISLAKHWTRTHKKSSKDLYLAYHGILEPTCACGCGSEVKYLDFGRGFSLYKWGHAASVKNNFQTEKSVANSKKTRKWMHQEGLIPIWSKGLTKETDERLIATGTNGKKWLESHPERRVELSDRMRKNRRNGTVKSPSGEKNGNWKGGISPLYTVCHSNPRLYSEWKYPLLVESKFMCSKCGTQKSPFEIHHDQELMCEIVKMIASQNNWNQTLALNLQPDDSLLFEKKMDISEAVANYHIENKVSGICLCKECHKKIHKSHNF